MAYQSYNQVYQSLFSPAAQRKKKQREQAYEGVRREMQSTGMSREQRQGVYQARAQARAAGLEPNDPDSGLAGLPGGPGLGTATAGEAQLQSFLKETGSAIDPETNLISVNRDLRSYAAKQMGVTSEQFEKMVNFKFGRYAEQQKDYLGTIGQAATPEFLSGKTKYDPNDPSQRLAQNKEQLFAQIARNVMSATSPEQKATVLKAVLGQGPGAQQLLKEYGDVAGQAAKADVRQGTPGKSKNVLEEALNRVESVYQQKVPQPVQRPIGNIFGGLSSGLELSQALLGTVTGSTDVGGKKIGREHIEEALENMKRGAFQVGTLGMGVGVAKNIFRNEKMAKELEFPPMRGTSFHQIAKTKGKRASNIEKALWLTPAAPILALAEGIQHAEQSKYPKVRAAGHVAGFAGDVMIDPLSYVSLGSGGIGSAAVKTAGSVAERAMFRKLVGEGVEKAARTGGKGVGLDELAGIAREAGVDAVKVEQAVQRARAFGLEAADAYGRGGVKHFRSVVDTELGSGATSKILPKVSVGKQAQVFGQLRGGYNLRAGIGPAKLAVNLKEGSPLLRQAMRTLKYGNEWSSERIAGTDVAAHRIGRAYDKFFEKFSPASMVGEATEGIEKAGLSREFRRAFPAQARAVKAISDKNEGVRRLIQEGSLEKIELSSRTLDKLWKQSDTMRGEKLVSLIEEGTDSPYYAEAIPRAGKVGNNQKRLDRAIGMMQEAIDDARRIAEEKGIPIPTLEELMDVEGGKLAENYKYFPHAGLHGALAEQAGFSLPQLVGPARKREMKRGTFLGAPSGEGGVVLPSGRFRHVQELSRAQYGEGALVADPLHQARSYVTSLAHAAKNVGMYEDVAVRGFGAETSRQIVKELRGQLVSGQANIEDYIRRGRENIVAQGIDAMEAGQEAADRQIAVASAVAERAEKLAEGHQILEELGARHSAADGMVKTLTKSVAEKRDLAKLAREEYRVKKRSIQAEFNEQRAAEAVRLRAEVRTQQTTQSQMVSQLKKLDSYHRRNLEALDKSYQRQLDGLATTPARAEQKALKELYDLGQEMRAKKAGLETKSGRTVGELAGDIAEAELRLAHINASKITKPEYNVLNKVTRAQSKFDEFAQLKAQRDELGDALRLLREDKKALIGDLKRTRSSMGLKQNKYRLPELRQAAEEIDEELTGIQSQLDAGVLQSQELDNLVGQAPSYFDRVQTIRDSLTQEELASPLGSLLTQFKGKEALDRVSAAARERAAITMPVRARVRRAEHRAATAVPEAPLEREVPMPTKAEIADVYGHEGRQQLEEESIASPEDLVNAQRQMATMAVELREGMAGMEEAVRIARAMESDAPSRQARDARISAEADLERARASAGTYERQAARLSERVNQEVIVNPVLAGSHVLDAETAAMRTAVVQARMEDLARAAAREETIYSRTARETNTRLNRLRSQNLRELIDDSNQEINATLAAQPERRRMAFLNNVLADLHPMVGDRMIAAGLHEYLAREKHLSVQLVDEWVRLNGTIDEGYRRAVKETDTSHLDAMMEEAAAADQLGWQAARDIPAEAEAAAQLTREGQDLNFFLDDLSNDEALLETVRNDRAGLKRAANAQALAVAQLQRQRPELKRAMAEAQTMADGAHIEFADAMERSLRYGMAEEMMPNLGELKWVALNLPYAKKSMFLPNDIASAIANAASPGAANRFMGGFAKYTSSFKRGVLLSAGSTMRRVIGNVYNAAVYQGVTPDEFGKAIHALHVYRKVGGDVSKIRNSKLQRIMRYAQDHNIFEGKYVEQIAGAKGRLQWGLKHPISSAERLNFMVAANAEDAARLASFMHAMKNGMGPEEARTLIGKYHFFNHELTPFERNYMRNVFPFYAYLKNNTQLQLYNLFHRPGRLSNQAAMQQAFGEPERDPFAPRYILEQGGFALPLYRAENPVQDQGGIKDIASRMFPYSSNPKAGEQEFIFNNILDTGVLALPSQVAGTIPAAFKGDLGGNELLGSINPALKVIPELALNKSLYTGREFSKKPRDVLGFQMPSRLASAIDQLVPLTGRAGRYFATDDYGRETYAEGLLGEISGITMRPSTETTRSAEAGRRLKDVRGVNEAIQAAWTKQFGSTEEGEPNKRMLQSDELGPYEKSSRLNEALAMLTQGKDIGNLLGAAKAQTDQEALADLPGGLGTTGGPAVQIALRAANAGFQGEDLVTAVAVALAESSGDPGARALNASEDSRGLWQINSYAHPELAQGGDLFDPDYNAEAAMAVLQKQGWEAWSVYKSGKYQDYLEEAMRAVTSMQGGGQGGGAPINAGTSYNRKNLSDITNVGLNVLQEAYPNIEIGGYATGGHTANSDHYTGRALDFMSRDNVEAGYDAALHFENNAEQLGVKYIIWQGQIWSLERAGEGWRPYHGSSPHTDHVHISFY